LKPVKRGDKYGFVNPAGKIVIPPQFDAADSFSEGLAAVDTRGAWGFIDQTGKMVIPPQFEECTVLPGLCAVLGTKVGYRSAKLVIQAHCEGRGFRPGPGGTGPGCSHRQDREGGEAIPGRKVSN
jgi:hypothetical protein